MWVIELHSGPDNRLTHDLINKGLKPALDIVEREWRARRNEALGNKDKNGAGGALIIVGRRDQDKFFSNGHSDLLYNRSTIAQQTHSLSRP